MGYLRKLWPAGGRRGMGEPGGRFDLLALILAGICLLAISVVFNEFGMIHFEWWGYVPYHLGPGSIWAKIFDNRALDQGVYAGRELSYLVDHVDMLLMARSVQWGWPLFISITHVLGCVGIGVWVARFAERDLRLGSLVGLLLALLFWTTPYVYLHFLMRTAKVLTAAGAVLVATEIYRACHASRDGKGDPLSRRHAILIALGAGVMSFSDRQGFYLLLCALGLVALEWMLSRTRAARGIFGILLGVLAIELVYFFWIAPALTKVLWGYAPDFSFNRLPLAELLDRPAEFAGQAWRLVVQNIGFTLGRMPSWAVLLVLAVAGGGVLVRGIRARTRPAHLSLAVVTVAMLLGIWVMYMLMILRHPPLLWADLQTVYYWIPTAALVVVGTAVGLANWADRFPGRRTILALVLLPFVGSNIAALPGHRRVFAGGHLEESIQQSREMRYALTHRGGASYVVPADIKEIAAFWALYELAPEPAYPAVPWEQFGAGGLYPRTRDAGANVRFIEEFGGNADARFLSLSGTGRFFGGGDGSAFIGTTNGPMEMRVGIPANRLRGELRLQRTGTDTGTALSADFVIYAQPKPHAEPRFERWRSRVELPAGQMDTSVGYEIDGSGLPSLFTVEIPAAAAGQVVAGWRNPEITHVGRDSADPVWFFRSTAPVVALDEAALAKLLPGSWRPVRALMRNGRDTATGIELSPGGEIWFQVERLVSKFTGTAVSVTPSGRNRVIGTRAFWYKGGRLEVYKLPALGNEADGTRLFQAWSAEPGGWLVIATDPHPDLATVQVRILEVEEGR
jgi:ABC-type polysaccharide/polyol phosphate export permease